MSESLRLNLGCGTQKIDGFLGVDVSPECGADIVHDLKVVPWPWADDSVDEVLCSHFLEHLTGAERIVFMDELWRVLKPDAAAVMITPHWNSYGAVQDPTHQWPPVCEYSYHYFNRRWREMMQLEHYGIRANFEAAKKYNYSPVWAERPESEREFAVHHYVNVAYELHVRLTKRP